ncbi:MAG: hypothetical protein HZY79_08955 [Rhodoblastus sp.]|nr:MAG: hypothetical protein HZY79_08955 [Rhodoblastus sp.]
MPLIYVEQHERNRARLKQLLEARWAAEAAVQRIAAGADRASFGIEGPSFDELVGEGDGERNDGGADHVAVPGGAP